MNPEFRYWAVLCALFSLSLAIQIKGAPWDHGPLEVSSSGRYLQHTDGTPFLWIGDTAWDLVQKLTQDEVETYFANRKAKGYTVIQITGLGQDSGLVKGINENGSVPFAGGDPYQRNPSFWNYVDWVVETAAAHDLYLLFLPTWGYYGSAFNDANAHDYGAFLGARYQNSPNIIWSMGGDITGNTHNSIWHNMAAGILSADSEHLMTYHPSGGQSSAAWFHASSWLDFNMYQSSHGSFDNPNAGNIARTDWGRSPVKPTINGEPLYEHIPLQFWVNPNNPRFTAYDVRKDAYRSLFAGAFGHTYGHSSVWQMLKPGATPRAGADPQKYWNLSLDDPGAGQMAHVGNLLVSRPVHRIPDESMLSGGIGSGDAEMRATRGIDYAFVYFPKQLTKTILLGKISGSQVQLTWYHPSTGEHSVMGTYSNSGSISLTPPSNSDWVLVIDNVAAGFAPPGTTDLWYGSGDEVVEDALSWSLTPALIPRSGSFTVEVNYSCAEARDIVVNVFDADAVYRGEGKISCPAGSSGTVSVTVSIQGTIAPGEATLKGEHRPAGGIWSDSLINIYESVTVDREPMTPAERLSTATNFFQETATEDGYLVSPEMGDLYVGLFPWVFSYAIHHAREGTNAHALGWLYTYGPDYENAAWFYDEPLGRWWFTVGSVYPWVYVADNGWTIIETPLPAGAP